MKKLVAIISVFVFSFSFAQTVDADGNLQTSSNKSLESKSADGRQPGWFKSGTNSILFGQSSFSDWQAGGVNSIALNANVDYEFNLTRGKHIWDNRIILGYGTQKNEGDESRKTNDIIDLTSSYGYEFKKHWYYAAALNFKTQFTSGYDYSTDPNTKISNFMAPGFLQLGVGVDYKPSENLQVNIHPATARMTFVSDEDLQFAGNYGLKEDGDASVFGFGAYLGARYKFNVLENVSLDNRLGVYSDYLDKPLNMDIAFQSVLDLKVNKFISAQVALNLLYDEDQIKRTQVKQTLGVGFTYKFDNKMSAEEIEALKTAETVGAAVEAVD